MALKLNYFSQPFYTTEGSNQNRSFLGLPSAIGVLFLFLITIPALLLDALGWAWAGREVLSAACQESCLHSKDSSFWGIGLWEINWQLDATRVVCVYHVAQCDAKAWAAWCRVQHTCITAEQLWTSWQGRLCQPEQHANTSVCSPCSRASSGISTENSTPQCRLKLNSWGVCPAAFKTS